MGESHGFFPAESITSATFLVSQSYNATVMRNQVLALRSLRRCEKPVDPLSAQECFFIKRTQQPIDSKETSPKDEPGKTHEKPAKPDFSPLQPESEPVSTTLDCYKFNLLKNNLPLAAPRCTLMLSNAASLSNSAASSPRQHYSRGRRYGPRLRLPGSVPRPSAGIKSS
jgi:hypothetical protein